MYGRKACQLIKEFVSGESGQLTSFNSDLFSQVMDDCNSHVLQLDACFRKMHEEGSINNQTGKDPNQSGALIHHLALVRNKRCLMAYVYNRAETIQNLGWTIDATLPEEISEKFSSTEKEYHKNHFKILKSYSSAMDIDLAVDMVPPKDPCIKVRVLEEIGRVVLSDQSANLALHSIHFLRRTDAERYISEGRMEELTS